MEIMYVNSDHSSEFERINTNIVAVVTGLKNIIIKSILHLVLI